MDYLVGFLFLFIYIGPIYVGYITIDAFIPSKKSNISSKISCLTNTKKLLVSIVLIILVPMGLIYSTLAHVVPNGNYELQVSYHLYCSYDEYNEQTDAYDEHFVDENGVAPLIIAVDNEVEFDDESEDYLGNLMTKHHYYSNVRGESIILPYFGDDAIYLDIDEIESNRTTECELYDNDRYYQLEIEVGEISDETLGYTLEDRIEDITLKEKLEYTALFLLSLISIIGYFIGIRLKEK